MPHRAAIAKVLKGELDLLHCADIRKASLRPGPFEPLANALQLINHEGMLSQALGCRRVSQVRVFPICQGTTGVLPVGCLEFKLPCEPALQVANRTGATGVR